MKGKASAVRPTCGRFVPKMIGVRPFELQKYMIMFRKQLSFVSQLPIWGRALALGIGVWLVFLLVLEPDNLHRAQELGSPLLLKDELVRLGVASLLGGSMVPFQFLILKSIQKNNYKTIYSYLIYVIFSVILGFLLILLSYFLASIYYNGVIFPKISYFQHQILSNLTLVSFFLFLIFVFIKAIFPNLLVERGEVTTGPSFGISFSLKDGGVKRLFLKQKVLWIEAQGNYVAVHFEDKNQLIRSSLEAVCQNLIPLGFIRIHRRILVNQDHIKSVKRLGSGDFEVILISGQSLRGSRSYRQAIRSRLKENLVPVAGIEPATF